MHGQIALIEIRFFGRQFADRPTRGRGWASPAHRL